MTPLPPRRRQHPLHLDGVWLVTGSIEGSREVPGMSVVADPRGFTIVGPEPGTERTVPWEQTTSFTCQRPARLPDGSPATVLEVGLANGRVLELLLPVNRIPPSETVVVETELAVMAEQYGGGKPVPKLPGVTSSPPVGDLQISPTSSKVSPSNGSAASAHERALHEQINDSALFEVPRVEDREQVAALALNGSRSNGSSAHGSSRLAVDTAVSPPTAPPEPVVVPQKPAVADPALDSSPVSAKAPVSAPDPVSTATRAPQEASETGSAGIEAPKAGAPEKGSPEAGSLETGPDEAEPAESTEVAQAGDMERRENRLFKMLVALIGVVVLVLIAELVLVLFVLNHSPNAKGSSVQSPTAMIVHVPNATSPIRGTL